MTKSNNTNGTDVPSVEPSENDPCMGKSSNENKNVFVRFRSAVCERWGLSHRVFYVGFAVIIWLVILLIIVITLVATWPRISHSQLYPVCTHAECLRAASQIREAMNSTASPCTDLWGWACGGWLSKHPMPKDRYLWNQKEELVYQEATKIRDLMANLNFPLRSTSIEFKLKQLYEACVNVDVVNSDGAGPLNNMILELGGWYILRNWNDDDVDPSEVLKQLHVKYGASPFFKITVEQDPYSPGKYIIRISPSGLGLPDKEYYYKDPDDRIQNAYKELIRDVVIYLGSARNEAEKFGNDIFHYEKRIAEITPDRQLLQHPIKTCNHRTVSELKQTLSNIPLYDILTLMFPEASISESSEVIVTSMEYLTEISQIIASSPRKTMNGYLIWTLVRHYLPYLSEKYTSALDNFRVELFGVKERLKRWEICANVVYQFMDLAINTITEKETPRTPVSNETIKIVTDTYQWILKTVQQKIEHFEPKSQLYSQLKTKLSNLQLQIGLPKSTDNNTYIKEYYSRLSIKKGNFFASVRQGFEFKNKLAERLLTQPSQENIIIETVNKMPPKAVYSPSNHLIIIPKSLLTYPVFESKFPRSVVYGRLGVEMARAILSAVLPYGSFWTGERKLLSSYHIAVNESLKSISGSQYCLYKFILNLNVDLSYAIANETALSILKEISALRVANEALKASLMNGKHIHQPALEEYEDSSLYFLSYAQTQCSESTNQFQNYDNLVNFNLPQRSLLYVMWAQLPEFSESLGCSFNKKEHCRIIV